MFNPSEVVPEFVADVGIKKGEKVDFVVMKEGAPVMLLEAKHWKQKLDNHDGQLLRYFHVCKARFSVLTNGVEYRFFTDLVVTNKMDDRPFLDFDITNITDLQIEELKRFHKSYFDVVSITAAASELKYTAALRAILVNEFKAPSDGFVRFFTKQVYSEVVTDKIVFQFSDLLRKSMHLMLSEMISDRLKAALDQEEKAAKKQEAEPDSSVIIELEMFGKERLVETTPEEMEAFYIVKSMLRKHVDPNRVTYRDAQSYMAILLDDNNRKTICRLYFTGQKRKVATLDVAKKEVFLEITDLDDIYQLEDLMKATINTYLGLAAKNWIILAALWCFHQAQSPVRRKKEALTSLYAWWKHQARLETPFRWRAIKRLRTQTRQKKIWSGQIIQTAKVELVRFEKYFRQNFQGSDTFFTFVG